MKSIHLDIPGIDAHAMGLHLLMVIKHYVSGKKVGSILPEKMATLEAMDQAYLKLNRLSDAHDDETPQPLSLTVAEAEAMIRAFTDDEYKNAALQDQFYQNHSYAEYFGLIYAKYLKRLSEGYVEALNA